jgi:hypothetical protein
MSRAHECGRQSRGAWGTLIARKSLVARKTKGPKPSSGFGPFAFAQGDGPLRDFYTSSSTSAAASTGAATGSSTRGGGASKPAGGWMSISA